MLRRLMTLGFFLVMVTVVSTAVDAQDCDRQSRVRDIGRFLKQIEVLDSPLERLMALIRWYGVRYAHCESLLVPEHPIVREPLFSFNNRQDGLQPVLGLLAIPRGDYRVRVVTDGYFIADVDAVEGECETSGVLTMFNILEGQASGGSEVLFQSINCKAFVSVSNVTDDWTLEFYKIGSDETAPLVDEYSSQTLGMTPLIGPIRFDDGYYRAIATTEGFLISHVYAAAGECGPDRSLFSLTDGQGHGGAEALFSAKNCVAYVTVNNATKPWTLTFEPIE